VTDVFANMVNHVYGALGRAAQYVEGEAAAVDCSVIVSHDLTQWGDIITVQNDMAMLSVRKIQIEDRPRRGGTFTLATGQEYRVERVMISDDHEHRSLVVEVE